MPKRILVVDDDPLVLKSVCNLLKANAYDVVGVKSGKEAEEKIKASLFDLIVCDIRMPEDDGIFVVKSLKRIVEEKDGLSIPFLFITGYASEDAPIDAVKLGADDYILKPFDNDQFLSAVKKSIDKPRASVQNRPNFMEICLQMKRALKEFHDKYEREVFENKALQELISSLEKYTDQLESKLVEEE